MTPPPRRIVTGLDGDGRSCILFDGPAPGAVLWTTDAAPADNSGTADAGGGPISLDIGGSSFSWHAFPPKTAFVMHATDTIDYLVILSGEIALITEAGETLLRAGDVVVDRGVMHNWRNDSDAPCVSVVVNLPSHPVGAGATLKGVVGE